MAARQETTVESPPSEPDQSDTFVQSDAAQGTLSNQPVAHWPVPEEGFDVDDTTSDFDEGVANSTTSLSSSIYEYRKFHGRTFHGDRGDAQYWASNDDKQNESLDIVHHVHLLMLDNQLFKAPLTDVQKVLDVGTGTGIWATDVGDNYPSAEVIGIDISPIQPFWVPPNVTFQIDDCKLEWTFQDDSFDLIHIRWMFGSIADWNALFQQAYRCLKPGGWLESHEASTQFRSDDGTVEDESAMSQFSEALVQGGKKMGQSMTVVEDGTQRKAMEAAQFMNIREQDYKTPVGEWPKDKRMKEIGRYQQVATENDVEGVLVYVAQLLAWEPEEVHVLSAALRAELRSRKIHAYYRQKIVYAQKPE